MDVDNELDDATAPSKKRKVGASDKWKDRVAGGEPLRYEDVASGGVKKLRTYLRAMGCEVSKAMAADKDKLRQAITDEFDRRGIRSWHA